jgi:hypothetical protein
MIGIKREGTKVIIPLEYGPLNSIYPFSFDCGNEYYAELLKQHYYKKLTSLIEEVRQEEYNRGYKDGRAKRGKNTWFFSWLQVGKY